MIIQVRANNPASDGRSRAGRRFANGVIYRMELVPDPLGGPAHDAKAFLGEDGNPDMSRISQAGLAQIKADPVMSIVPSEEDEASVADYPRLVAELDAAQVRIAELEEAQERIEELEAANLSLKEQAADLAEENKALKAAAAKAPKKNGGPAVADQTTPTVADAPSSDAPAAAQPAAAQPAAAPAAPAAAPAQKGK